MPYIPKISKTPTAAYSVSINFSGWSVLATDDLASAVATVSPTGLTLGTVSINATTEKATIPISGGSDGTTYRITCSATTTASDVLVGYIDVLVSSTQTDGTVFYPSMFLPFIDNARTMDLLFDGSDLDDDEATPTSDTIDGNSRAFALAQVAWRTILQAATRGELYTVAELTDYANDTVRGADLVELGSQIFWCKLLRRRRYTKGEPQGEEGACEEAEQRIEALRRGERIFDLSGVTDSATGVARTNLLGESTRISTGSLGQTDVTDHLGRFWAATPPSRRTWRRGDWLRD